ncbi:DUF4832 domain-containing protein [Ructibacterium gallinarum]|uniref:DUF4832 domain-containing protein n=1 Tax=Ructibacterium gallinarum TaxID=2779355 RepID=A0A9D5M3L1_9FIRM|nr:DUF4832 domain-containing protein [Ructibacterium gallinarum]MBE5040898.1 DUF4832 domain-containing protein [Ructibacterium gallinarum]
MNDIFYVKASTSKKYIDLRPIIDDKTVLKNPHKGWYYHYIDNGKSSPLYRDKLDASDHFEKFPGMNHLYLRVDWCDIEPQEGIFEWEWIDEIINVWAIYGYKFSFRVCCYEPYLTYATPEWVRLAGARGEYFPSLKDDVWDNPNEKLWEPDYGDPIFLNKLENMLSEFGKKYNGHPLVEFVDIGTYGTWGEGHRYAGGCAFDAIDVLRKHVDLHLKYFSDTTLILNDDMIDTACRAEGEEAAKTFMYYCIGKGIGARDDSICVKYYSDTFGYDTLSLQCFFEEAYKNAPVDLEFAHYRVVDSAIFKEGLAFVEALKNAHASYAGFHGYLHPWIDERHALTEYIANRLGYWYFITGIDLPECVCGTKTVMKLYVENHGWAKAYNSYTLKICAINENAKYELFSCEGINLHWENKHTETIILNFKNVPKGKYKLALGLYEGEIPIKLAIKNENWNCGMYELCDFSVGELL